MVEYAEMTKEEFERGLDCQVVGEYQARRNRNRRIKKLGESYHKYAGKISLYDMFQLRGKEVKR